MPVAAAIERTRQWQSAIEQRASGEVVEGLACRQRGGFARQGGVVEPGEQAFDPLDVVQFRLAAEGGVRRASSAALAKVGLIAAARVAPGSLTCIVLQPAASSATSKGSSIRFDDERGGDLPEAGWMDVWLMCIRRARAL